MANTSSVEQLGTLSGPIGLGGLRVLEGRLLFPVLDPNQGSELGVSDGTAEGTGLLADLFPSDSGDVPNSSSPDRLTLFNGAVFFQARSELGSDIWFSDGTTEGTQLLRDLAPGSPLTVTSPLTVVNDRLLFETYQSDTVQRVLWASDGTAEGTSPISDPENRVFNFGSTQASLGERLLFSSGGRELWVTDGTEGGTQLLQELAVATMLTVGDVVFMEASDRNRGYELWVSDGTVDGTRLVKDLRPGITSSAPNLLRALNGEVYFTAKGLDGEQLWASDGTEDGTRLVKAISPLSGLISRVTAEVDGKLLFVTRTPETGMELWGTDGTEAGTQLIQDINPGAASSLIANMTQLGDRVVFTASGPDGTEPWVTDGTPEGTVQLKDIYEGYQTFNSYSSSRRSSRPVPLPAPGPLQSVERPHSSAPRELTVVGDRLYFTAGVGKNRDLWQTDGTPEGTVQVASAEELGGSRIENLTLLDGDLVFSLRLPDPSRSQLWRVPSVGSDPVNPEPNNPEPTEPDLSNPDPSNPDPSNPEPAEPEPVEPEPAEPVLNEIFGTDAQDSLNGTDQADVLLGFEAEDVLWGDAGADRLDGGGGNDQLWGADGDDLLLGQSGDDILGGDAGDDVLLGGAGSDQLMGGPGADRFQVDWPEAGVAPDRIMDFQAGVDRLQLQDTLRFEQLSFVPQGNGIWIQVNGLTTVEVVGASEITAVDFVGF